MTVQCSDCKRVLGEKCGKCGAPALTYWVLSAGADGETRKRHVAICKNPVCDFFFEVCDGGVSHGLCPECLARAMDT